MMISSVSTEDQRKGRLMAAGIVRVAAFGGRCWMCGATAVAGEKLAGRRHKVRLLCKRHDQLVFAGDASGSPPPDPRVHSAATSGDDLDTPDPVVADQNPS
ncbi:MULTISPECIES: hypothetical protein [Actinoalloteichus]|uniref:hypothetical protein n=1 Tax=Actinoalloteichus TaxID=65496 RepID=UPI0012FCFB13|nr:MULTISPECIES: hypothetical protein [Actinoalloteichus]